MNIDDARKLAGMIENVDGGCPFCVKAAVDNVNRTFPEFVWSVDEDGEVTVAAPGTSGGDTR